MKKLLVYIICTVLMLCSTVFALPEQIQRVENVSEAISEQADNTATLTADFDEGDGSEASPYIISTAEQLLSVASIVENTTSALYFKLASDIDLEGAEWTPIGTENAPFSGGFNGNGYTVSNLKITTAHEYSGFFGVIKEADISKLSIEKMTIQFEKTSVSQLYAGLLVANVLRPTSGSESTKTFSEISVSGSIDVSNTLGAVYVGGIVGKMQVEKGNCLIANTMSVADISVISKNGNAYVGGIVGYISDYTGTEFEMSIDKSYYYGSCSAVANNNTVRLGGIVGYIWSNGPFSSWASDDEATLLSNEDEYSLKNCFAGGSVYASGKEASKTKIGRVFGDINQEVSYKNCAYIETQTISALAGGKPHTSYTGSSTKITAEQAASASFLLDTFGFDFVNIWMIDSTETTSLPRLGKSDVPGDLFQDMQLDNNDLEALAKHIAGTSVITDQNALKRANVYVDSNTDLSSNIDIKDLILLAQYVSGKNVTLG